MRLMSYRYRAAFVLGLSRGGIVVGHEVARLLRAPFDLLTPAAFGPAPACGSMETLSERNAGRAQGDAPDVRLDHIRGTAVPPDINGRTVILVDDGLIHAPSTRTVVEIARRARPARLILAVPLGAPAAVAELTRAVDDLVCLYTPETSCSPERWYADFRPVSDEQIVDLMARTHRPAAPVDNSDPLVTSPRQPTTPSLPPPPTRPAAPTPLRLLAS